jgi:hypothetical protein
MLRSLRSLRGSVRLGRSASLHSHGSLHPHFCSLGLATQPLFAVWSATQTTQLINFLTERTSKRFLSSVVCYADHTFDKFPYRTSVAARRSSSGCNSQFKKRIRPLLRAQRLRVAPKQSAQRPALGLGVSGQAPQTYGLLKRLAYPETPGR